MTTLGCSHKDESIYKKMASRDVRGRGSVFDEDSPHLGQSVTEPHPVRCLCLND